MKNTYIYVLKCPNTGEVKYVGKANKPRDRYKCHLTNLGTQSRYKQNWIKSLRDKGQKPVLEIIRKVPIEEWKKWEKYYIEYYRDKGFKLTNCTDGGDGLGFGNQTSFKKGLIPWNFGTKKIITKRCRYCNKVFHPKDKRRNYCSRSHAAKDNTGFKKEFIPWNKEKFGYGVNSVNCKTILQIEPFKGNVIGEYPSLAEAGRRLGISADAISNALCGRSKSSGGYRWEVKK